MLTKLKFNFRSLLNSLFKEFGTNDLIFPYSNNNLTEIEQNARNITFTMSFIAISTKLINVDDVYNEDEIAYLMKLFASEKDKNKIKRLFLNAISDQLDASIYAKKIYNFFFHKPKLYKELIISLYRIAESDGPVNNKEICFIYKIGEVFDFSRREIIEFIKSEVAPDYDDPYVFLKIPKNIPKEHITKYYHEFIKNCHPDSLAKFDNVSDEYRILCSERFKKATQAYKEIRNKHK